MPATDAATACPVGVPGPPLVFISHRHVDQPIADVLRNFIIARSGGRVGVFQSSSASAQGPRVGRELQRELKEHLWKASVIVLTYTSAEEDWSYCMWECGVATHPESPETKVIVFQCGARPPTVYADAVRVDVHNPVDIQKFVNDFLTSTDFFPDHDEAIAPGFTPNGDDVQQAARQLADELGALPYADSDDGEDWPTMPYLRLQLTYKEVDEIRDMNAEQGVVSVRRAARVVDIDSGAQRLFGLGRTNQCTPFADLLTAWQEGRPGESTKWVADLLEQVRVGSWWKFPRFRWEPMRSVDDADGARYVPMVTRVRSVPRQRNHEFDVYFGKFSPKEGGAMAIELPDEREGFDS